jgi:hypothetical protein
MKRLPLAMLTVCLLAGSIRAADFTWDGGAYVSGTESTRYWNLTGNWNPGGLPGDGNYNPACNFNHDHSVDTVDLLMLVENYAK